MRAWLPALSALVSFVPSALSQTAPISSPASAGLRLPEHPYRYAEPRLPAHVDPAEAQALDTTPADNRLTDDGATLGRVLFYDPRLSADLSVSCASCHQQAHAFADPRRRSVGSGGVTTDRNAKSLINLRWQRGGLFWDERADGLEDALDLATHHRAELGPGAPAALEARIGADPRYPPLFRRAFGDPAVSAARISQALAQFVRAIASFDSRYDRAAAKVATMREDFPDFTPAENRGKQLFLGSCMHCHHLGGGEGLAFFSMFRSLNNGLDPDAEVPDAGRGDVTFNPSDVGLFKPGSLRNIGVTGPYMYDGRLATLADVVEHYSSGVQRHPTVGPVRRLMLPSQDKADLVAFLETLTDEELLRDPRFSNPWADGALPRPTPALSLWERLDRGQGLLPGEARVWLASLDQDGDGRLGEDECAPLVEVLLRSNARLRFTGMGGRARGAPGAGRGARGRGRRGPEASDQPLPPQADLDQDGAVSPEERRTWMAFSRLIATDDGGRADVFLDRFLRAFRIPPDQEQRLRDELLRVKGDLGRELHGLDEQALGQVQLLLGEAGWVRYQELIVERAYGMNRRPGAAGAVGDDQVWTQVLAFDADEDGALGPGEQRDLAEALDGLPGGLGQVPGPVDREQFVRRLLAWGPPGGPVPLARIPTRIRELVRAGDRNADGALDRAELVDYARETAFRWLIKEGVYTGGGFQNTIQHTRPALGELGLTSETMSQLDALLTEHTRAQGALKEKAVLATFPSFRATIGEDFRDARFRRDPSLPPARDD